VPIYTETVPSVWSIFRQRWRETRAHKGFSATTREIGSDLWEFLRESTPERKRRRYGDLEYDWDHHIDTTSATVTHRGRLIAAISGAPYQPTDPAEFREMMKALTIDLREFTFLDIGSGKGRTLLMASEFPFRRILGVELVQELHEIAAQNIAAFSSTDQKCHNIQCICADARDFQFPPEPLLLYLFNPLPAPAMQTMLEHLQQSLQQTPRHIRVIYHNPLSEQVLLDSGFLKKIGGTEQYSIFSN